MEFSTELPRRKIEIGNKEEAYELLYFNLKIENYVILGSKL